MPEEEIEYLDDNDNENNNQKNNVSSSMSSLKDAASNIINSNNYRSRKNNFANIEGNNNNNSNSNNNNNVNPTTTRNRALNGIKNQAANIVLNKVPHPALKVVSMLNNIKNRNSNSSSTGGVVRRNSGDSSNSQDGNNKVYESSPVDSDTNNDDGTSSGDTSSVNESTGGNILKSLNPVGSLVSGKGGLLGQFSFFGKIPVSLKIGILMAPFFIFLIILLIPISFVSMFGGLLGTDEVIASGGSTSSHIDYGDYELSSDGDVILHESLDSFLASQGTSLEEFNNLIASNVENTGYGTDAGVVAAAVTLIAELGNNYDVRIPYFWGGGHGQMITGAEGNWGSNQCRASANGRIYDYCGLDCSGFVAWAIWNGGFNIAARVTGQFQALPGAERVSLNSSSAVLAPGDLLESNSHIVLVVGVDEETNEYICAEASGYTTGVLFTRRPFSRSGYWGVRMSGFYERQVRS